MLCEERKGKKRSPNFTTQEVDLLCDLVLKYSKIIESKKTDCHTWQEKDTAWQRLTAEFNNLSQGIPRLNLRGKYESFKKELRKKASKQKLELYKTGGGINEVPILTPSEEKVYSLIMLSVDGLPARFDDDNVQKDAEHSEFEKREENTEIPSVEHNGEEIIYIETFENESDSPQLPIDEPSTSHYASKPSANEINDEEPQNTWKEWTPKILKGPVSKSLKVMRKKKHAMTKLQASQKINILADSKKELIELQILHLRKEMENLEKHHELKLKKAEEDLKCSKLDVEIKEVEKNIKIQTLKKLLNKNLNFP